MSEPWRYECPDGHRQVRRSAVTGWYCDTCQRGVGYVMDLKRGVRLDAR